MFVLLVTSAKEGYEDLMRYRCDIEENKRPVTIVTFDSVTKKSVETIKSTWQIQTGDIVKLSGRSTVPADMIVIFSSNYIDNNQCYVETMNIDGETNMKLKEGPTILKKFTDSEEVKSTYFEGYLEYELPSKNIHTFVGALHLDILGEAVPLDQSNLLLRSSMFVSTDWAYGVVVYTGQDTKVQMGTIVR